MRLMLQVQKQRLHIRKYRTELYETLENSVVYSSCAPCEWCLAAIASLGVHKIVCGVSYKEFCKLLPFDYQAVDREGLLKQLGIKMTLTESVLEEEGMHVFEWWGGEYHPIEELIAEMDEVKKKQKTGVTD